MVLVEKVIWATVGAALAEFGTLVVVWAVVWEEVMMECCFLLLSHQHTLHMYARHRHHRSFHHSHLLKMRRLPRSLIHVSMTVGVLLELLVV